MADKNTSALTAAGALGGTELIHLVDASGNSRKLTLSALKTFINTDPTTVPSSVPYRGARVKRTNNLAITSGVSTVVAWEAKDRDTDSIWSAGAPTRLTVPTGVTKVRLRGAARWAASGAVRQILFAKNGSSAFAGNAALNVPSSQDLAVQTDVLDVVAGEYFEMTLFHSDGAAATLSAHDRTWFALEIVQG